MKIEIAQSGLVRRLKNVSIMLGRDMNSQPQAA